jgi:predicted metalloendopeptidase
MKKATQKKVEKAVDFGEEAFAEIQRMARELGTAVKSAKSKYDALDPKTKKKIVAGLAGATAVVAGAVGYSQLKRDKKAPAKKKK